MLKPLIPKFIEEKFFDGIKDGAFDAFILFADLKSFTSITEMMMSKSRFGAERLSEIINNIFGNIIHIVYSYF